MGSAMSVAASFPPRLEGWPSLAELRAAIGGGAARVEVRGLWGAARPLTVALLAHSTAQPVLLLVAERGQVHRAALDLRFFLGTLGPGAAPPAAGLDIPGAGRVFEFPSPGPGAWGRRRQIEDEAERALVCYQLLEGEPPTLVVLTPSALHAPVLSPAAYAARRFRLTTEETISRDELVERLDVAGYERVEAVVEVGQWSLRGGIIDIYSPAASRPVRVELFGDEVESLRLFDPTTQRSVEARAAIAVLPLRHGPEDGRTLLDYLAPETIVALDDPALLEAPLDDAPAAAPLAELLAPFARVELTLVAGGTPAGQEPPVRIDLGTRSVGGFRGQFAGLAAQIQRWRGEEFSVRLIVNDEGQATRLRQILAEHGVPAWPEATLWGAEGLGILIGDCAEGFEIPALGLVVMSEEEIFGAQRRRLRRPLFPRGATIAAFSDLAPGDLVVHEAHGVGRYHGLTTLAVDGRAADFLLLEYGEGGRLYLPVERLDLISKYMGAPGGAARLDRLGGGAWQRVKESVRAALRQMAEDLLRLYAQRSVAERSPFAGDTPWQREFEAAFPFEETPDQLRAIEDVKADMEAARPMDRLVAGDVGYGKTEIALRAAFKAVADSRQVAVLVPTTVLAQQHFNTFADRFAAFPARVELLSRFRTPKEQKAVVAGLRRGDVDVVVGTHRLLSQDVEFKNLGLLVVDEEHRFGVAHKERIKQLRTGVDVLTLTATPIPRTLHMALSGVRDLSTIETAPLARLPVETVVAPFSRDTIRDAIGRELARGGQVFFVHNRIQSLPSRTTFIRGLHPQARVVMAHGQMGERELEAVMVKFVDGQADVLVSTAIVESGLDIPSSNTIIINRADRLGLAQLYQLRGRVGRERLQAYAYLLVPADGRLDETAQRRLRVIEEMTELGAGFKLALRDLEIRGTGNLLGAEQHGHIAAVGFDLYAKLLEEAVRELAGTPAATTVEPTITVEVEALLPDEYVPEVNQRLALYKRIAAVTSDAELQAMREELIDRFGPAPPAVEALLDIVGIRAVARRLELERLEARGGRAALTFRPSTPVRPERILDAIRRSKGRLTMRKEYTMDAQIPERPWPAVRDAVLALLASLA
ncbi:MAG: transcription-repair coupling factor [Candidatus Rokubacteria bacterium]|nr:transcription-repair coupling factor [Candidatus Rokubacteria bacterium]